MPRKANLQIIKRYVKVCSSPPSSFFWRYDHRRGQGNLTFWARKCWKVRFKSLYVDFGVTVCCIDTSTIESRENQCRSSRRYAWESGEHSRDQLKSQLLVEYKIRSRVGQVWAPAEGLPGLMIHLHQKTSCSCSVDGQLHAVQYSRSGLDFSSFMLLHHLSIP